MTKESLFYSFVPLNATKRVPKKVNKENNINGKTSGKNMTERVKKGLLKKRAFMTNKKCEQFW